MSLTYIESCTVPNNVILIHSWWMTTPRVLVRSATMLTLS